MVGDVFSFFRLHCLDKRGRDSEKVSVVRETVDGLGWLESIILLFGRCPPPCLLQIPWSDLPFPRNGTERVVPSNSGCTGLPVQAAFGGCAFVSFFLCTSTYLWIRKQAQQVNEGCLLGIAQSNQGGWLATHCPLEGRASRCWYELRNRNTRPF